MKTIYTAHLGIHAQLIAVSLGGTEDDGPVVAAGRVNAYDVVHGACAAGVILVVCWSIYPPPPKKKVATDRKQNEKREQSRHRHEQRHRHEDRQRQTETDRGKDRHRHRHRHIGVGKIQRRNAFAKEKHDQDSIYNMGYTV